MSEYDEEPRIHTVISPDSSNSSTFFNSIAFSIPRREDNAPSPNPPQPTQEYSDNSARMPSTANYDTMSMSMMADDLQSGDHLLETANQQTNPAEQYQSSQQGVVNQPNVGQNVYSDPLQQTYGYESQNQQANYYESQVPQDYNNYQNQSQPIMYDNQQTIASYQNQPQYPIDQYQIPASYANQSQTYYDPQSPEMTYGSQQQIGYENQQIAYTDPQQVSLYIESEQTSFPPQDQGSSGPNPQLNYDAQSIPPYANQPQPQEYIHNQNELLYNTQQPLAYQNESQVIFENTVQQIPIVQSPIYTQISEAGQYNEPGSNLEAQLDTKLANFELAVEAGDETSGPTSTYSYTNEQSETHHDQTVPDSMYQQMPATSQEIQAAELYSQQQNADATPGFFIAPYSCEDIIYDTWIPSEETKSILKNNAEAVHAGTYFPDKAHMTAPGVIYADDLVDKVGVNMARIFGEAEACKRKILTADNVTQDDSGLRELIKLGCYRSAINLTKRLLTLYGQGPGKVGHYSKQTPHSLQLWFTRISLLMRIREFSIAESEIAAFKNFDNPDLYYEYYPNTYGDGRMGSMVPFHFRLLAAEIPQYVRKFNETASGLNKILQSVERILKMIEKGEDSNEVKQGDGCDIDEIDVGLSELDLEVKDPIQGATKAPQSLLDTIGVENKDKALAIWKKREIRTVYALVNASLFAKDYYNAFTMLTKLCEKDEDHRPQIKSAIGRLFLQHGDLTTAQNYFLEAANLRSSDSEADQVETLIDSALTSIAQNAYPEAFQLFQQALQIQPENFMVTNNMAVCLLYMGNVKEALSLMENTVKQNTPQLLQENVILNLSTIYELENSDGYKKNALLKLISQYKGDGINLASLKMPNLI